MTTNQPVPLLRGPLPGISGLLQPAAHAFLLAKEDTDVAVSGISAAQLWIKPGGAASLGFHLMHLAGSTDRLLTYARGEPLSEAQRAAMTAEKGPKRPAPSLEELLGQWRFTVEAALRQLAATPETALNETRLVGRAQLPSTVLGLIFHAAEHAQRHVGQIVSTSRIIKGLNMVEPSAES